ncbi:MAG: 4-(cytidine 5'-diphospho)-2-C-methyl-D-erythritol kinase [Solirubrobacteraceae bacterium]
MNALTTELAPAKVNLCLFVGPTRADGRHHLVTVLDSVSLVDGLEVLAQAQAQDVEDSVVCDGVTGPNLAAEALAALRAAGWAPPPLCVRIRKRIPVAAGMGGGSADAAAVLRLAPRLAPVADEAVARIAARLGADVPGQLHPGPSIATGAGELIAPVGALSPYGLLVIPQSFGLSAADVYREADRLGVCRPADELEARRVQLVAALPSELPPALVVNDLEPAAVSLAPEIEDALRAAREEGADAALVCGSGPTVIGVFWGRDGADRAAAAAGRLARPYPGALVAEPIGANP